MRGTSAFAASLLLLVCGPAAGAGNPPGGGPPSGAEAQAAVDLVERRIERGSDPAADAADAARHGQFGLIVLGRFLPKAAGITCFTPYSAAPEALVSYRHGDMIDDKVQAWYRYADRYNRVVAERPDYPYRDLCRSAVATDSAFAADLFNVTRAARPVAAPPRTLHEAARRGGPADVHRLLRTGDMDALDGLDMTPLAWAVARNNSTAVRLLLDTGANPWVGGARKQDALFWAARLGRRSEFVRMERLPGRVDREWSPMHLAAAASGGDATIIRRMIAQPHASFRLDFLDRPLPSAAALQPFLREDPALANALLWKAVDYPSDRPDLVKLALDHGARPDAPGSAGRHDTVLGTVASGIGAKSVEMVAMLLKAGPNPNALSDRERPIWLAIRTLKLDREITDIDDRATLVLRTLLSAGADINLPDADGAPPARLLLFPYHWNHEKLDSTFVTPALIAMLVRSGLDLNAEWRGKRILGPVEEQAGADSELARTLRRLGARR
jgi:hypothetical protein